MSDEPLDDVLGGHGENASGEFVRRVMRRVERREMTTQFVAFGWDLPREVVVESAKILAGLPELLRPKTTRRDAK